MRRGGCCVELGRTQLHTLTRPTQGSWRCLNTRTGALGCMRFGTRRGGFVRGHAYDCGCVTLAVAVG
eukprot:365019-Chlamydomonas_euryale.AAC.8